MAIANGFEVVRVGLRADTQRKGHVAWVMPDPATHEQRVRAAIVGAAGAAADAIHHGLVGGAPDEMMCGYHGDRTKAAEHLPELANDENFQLAGAFCQLFLRRPDAWSAVERLANMVMSSVEVEHGTMVRDIAPAVPQLEFAEIARFIRAMGWPLPS